MIEGKGNRPFKKGSEISAKTFNQLYRKLKQSLKLNVAPPLQMVQGPGGDQLLCQVAEEVAVAQFRDITGYNFPDYDDGCKKFPARIYRLPTFDHEFAVSGYSCTTAKSTGSISRDKVVYNLTENHIPENSWGIVYRINQRWYAHWQTYQVYTGTAVSTITADQSGSCNIDGASGYDLSDTVTAYDLWGSGALEGENLRIWYDPYNTNHWAYEVSHPWRFGKADANITAGSSGTISWYKAGVDSTINFSATLKYLHGGQQVDSGEDVWAVFHPDESAWIIVGASCNDELS